MTGKKVVIGSWRERAAASMAAGKGKAPEYLLATIDSGTGELLFPDGHLGSRLIVPMSVASDGERMASMTLLPVDDHVTEDTASSSLVGLVGSIYGFDAINMYLRMCGARNTPLWYSAVELQSVRKTTKNGDYFNPRLVKVATAVPYDADENLLEMLAARADEADAMAQGLLVRTFNNKPRDGVPARKRKF